MKIRSMKAHSGTLTPFGELDFHPRVNIIRGPNGIGKTTILEWASLLGHICLLSHDENPSGVPELEMRLCMTEHDQAFVDWLRGLDETNEIRRIFEKTLRDMNIDLSIFNKNVVVPESIKLCFYLKGVDESNLKSMLVDEKGMRDCISFTIFPEVNGTFNNKNSREIANILRSINAWSRPMQIEGVGAAKIRYATTPDTLARLNTGFGADDSLCAPVFFYLNTDMYEFGIGLDIRESPKDLRGNITHLLVERLQLITLTGLSESGQTLADCVPKTTMLELRSFDKIQSAWANIFKDHPLNGVTVKKVGDGFDEADFHWTISVSNREDGVSFISSGENQALFVLAMLNSLAQRGSCMLLDEPELHLSFWSGSRLIKEIEKCSKHLDAQAIIVTHLPHLYRNRLNSSTMDKLWERRNKMGRADPPNDEIGMIYLNRSAQGVTICYDKEAAALAAKESHADVMEVVDGLRLAERIPILPKFFR